ncbi:DNA polymerase III subunit delta [Malacoplasma iowae]|uniref:DNA-directed DNA polymerase n=1 Tax=Malacoplasma iowae 695 TaxID=1048830 RepID=A0A6P1LCW0_MALIO|nr:hypothetical protein [Malacoplasma iowae]VEU61975.1 DNA polymerase III subunit delta [Mycoplasmopsis fermentans]EGZ31563.1 hypothetical protein GUU_01057 [Malacoplasma iowae 695]QHG90027.2 hypothetical protein EER00_03995 [Malacoplasma iowae 695]WPL36244.1 hypothetical protein QX180_02385 [Malacoplasma iowae]WPL38472.1 hypothetical protein QX181_02745 [Malacoplasma iowae]
MELILSEDIGLIEFKKMEICKNIEPKIYVYDFEEREKIIDDLMQYDFFSSDEKTNVFITSFYTKKNQPEEAEINFLIELSKIKEKNIYVCMNKISTDQYLLSLFSYCHNLKKLNKWTSKKFIQDYLNYKKFVAPSALIDYLNERLPNDANSIMSELNKLVVWDIKKLNRDIIDSIIENNINDNVFNLIDNYFSNNYQDLILQMQLFEQKGSDLREIYNVMVSQLFLLKLYKLHFDMHNSFDVIVKEFKILKFQIDNWAKFLYQIDVKKIDSLLNQLLNLEKDVMLGKKDFDTSLKLFLLSGVA